MSHMAIRRNRKNRKLRKLDVIDTVEWPQIVIGLGVVFSAKHMKDLARLNCMACLEYNPDSKDRPEIHKALARRDKELLLTIASQLPNRTAFLISYYPYEALRYNDSEKPMINITVLWGVSMIRASINVRTGEYRPLDSDDRHDQIKTAVDYYFK